MVISILSATQDVCENMMVDTHSGNQITLLLTQHNLNVKLY